jgi:hypothetical protein
MIKSDERELTTRELQIYEAIVNLLLDKKTLQSVDIELIKSVAWGLYMAELINNTNPPHGYEFFKSSVMMALNLMELTEDELEKMLVDLKYSGKPL